jgi:hypothetical protein
MYDDKTKKIGSATYLKKGIDPYIPFLLLLKGTDCKLIKPMLDKTFQLIIFIDKDNEE